MRAVMLPAAAQARKDARRARRGWMPATTRTEVTAAPVVNVPSTVMSGKS
ncbi:MAG: hypothetical protein A4E61_00623 [Syntrophorhabdus sp. PtaB.Bin184]|nr:MAG: hypothetical protein A4E61_00623 [Syntrophorhabdus sp. PtaB.Bin184]